MTRHLLNSARATADVRDAIRSFLALCGGSATPEDIRRFIRPTNATRFDQLLSDLQHHIRAIRWEPDERRFLLAEGPWNLALRDFPMDLLRTFDHGPSLPKMLAQTFAPPPADASVRPALTPASATASGELLTVPRLTAQREFPEQLNEEQLNGDREHALMQRLAAFVGEDDMRQWGGDWRKNWVRRIPRRVTKALSILEAESKEGWKPHTSRAAALKDLARRLPA